MVDKVESDGKRIDVEAVAIVDKETVVDALVDFEAHLDGMKRSATAGDHVGGIAEEEEEGDAVHSVLGRSGIDKRDRDRERRGAEMRDGETCRLADNLTREKTDLDIGGGAPEIARDGRVVETFDDERMYVLVVGAIDEEIGMGKELKFFGNFLLTRDEVLVVSLTDIGKDADRGLDDILETAHFVGLGDAGLEDSHIVLRRKLPYRERDADLRVVALGVSGDAMVGGEEL